MHWKIHPPRPSRFPSGGDFAPLGPWEISWASGSVFSKTSRLSAVYGYNTKAAFPLWSEILRRLRIKRSVLIRTLSESSISIMKWLIVWSWTITNWSRCRSFFYRYQPTNHCYLLRWSSIKKCRIKDVQCLIVQLFVSRKEASYWALLGGAFFSFFRGKQDGNLIRHRPPLQISTWLLLRPPRH